MSVIFFIGLRKPKREYIRTKWPRPNTSVVTTLIKFYFVGSTSDTTEKLWFSPSLLENCIHISFLLKEIFFLQREMNALEMLCPLLSIIRNTKLSINGIALLHLLWSFFLHVSPFSPYSTNGTCQVSPFSISLTCNLIVGLFILSILIQIFRSSDKVNEFERTQLRIPALFR